MSAVTTKNPPREAVGHADLDRAIATLQEKKEEWARLPIAEKIRLLEQLRARVATVAKRWVDASTSAKGIPAGSPVAGEEWAGGPWSMLIGINGLIRTLRDIQATGTPKVGAARTRPDGQLVVQVFPASLTDRLLFTGITGEVWMEPGVTEAGLPGGMAALYRDKDPRGAVALVLGAGNVSSIGPLDVLHKLFTEGHVSLLKLNPVNDYLGPLVEELFADFAAAGYVRFAYGAADVGAYLATHPGIDEIHMTGSDKTHDAIVFGTGPDAADRKRRRDPVNTKPIAAELGNVSPTIVVPGKWSASDIRMQAEHIATQKMHNGGFNCIAAQVLVLAEGWDQGQALVDEVAKVIGEMEPRKPYYPGAGARQQEQAAGHAGIRLIDEGLEVPRTIVTGIDSEADDTCFRTEAFAPVLATTTLPGATAAEFLENAVRFANDRLWGTLGANLIIDTKTQKELGPAFEAAIADLRYGNIAVNLWTGIGYALAMLPWGAFPGHTIDDIQSGIGFVHNTYLFDRPQKGVVYGPFRPMPKPPWFSTNKQSAEVSRRLIGFEVDHNPARLPGIFAHALRG